MSTGNDFLEEYRARRPRSLAMRQRARSSMGGGVGHDLRHFEPVPLYVERGEGGRVWDVDGNEYIDFLMGNGALILGHAPEEVVEAVSSTVGRGTHFGSDHPLQIEWAERICSMVPSADRVRFVNSGTEATLLAIRLARGFTGRRKFLRFEGHFHGWHDDVVHGFQPPFEGEGYLGVPPSVSENVVMIPDGDLELVEATLCGDPEIAAVILEPSGASWGRVPIAPDFLKGLRRITEEREVLLIFDEVVTGFRFSPGGAQELYSVQPDLSCFAKIVAGGLPGGALSGRADIMRRFDIHGDAHRDRYEHVIHFGTFNASPLAAAAGNAVLKCVETGEPTRRADGLAGELRGRWDDVLQRHGIAGYVYGPSSTFHVYFETDPERLLSASTREDLHTTDGRRLKGMPGEMITRYQQLLRHHGVDVMSFTGGVVSAAHTERDIEQATTAFEHTVVALRDAGLISCL